MSFYFSKTTNAIEVKKLRHPHFLDTRFLSNTFKRYLNVCARMHADAESSATRMVRWKCHHMSPLKTIGHNRTRAVNGQLLPGRSHSLMDIDID